MAQATLRDLRTNRDFVIAPLGCVFGRNGGNADVQLPDDSIAHRHAQVSFKDGMWLLETLNTPSSARPPRPLFLEEGATFLVGRHEFEVLQLDIEDGPMSSSERTVIAPTSGPPPTAPEVVNSAARALNPPPPPVSALLHAPTLTEVEANASRAPSAGMGELLSAIPKAVLHYVSDVPQLVFKPFSTVRETIDTLPVAPLGRFERIGYALPALVFASLFGSICAGIAALISGSGFQASLFFPMVPALVAIAAAAVMGFFFDPVCKWFIALLKGESNARSRTNYFVQLMSLSILLAVPGSLGAVLGALPLPFVGLVGQVLAIAATVLSLWVIVQWFISFEVVKWFQTVLMILGGLLILGAAWQLGASALTSVKKAEDGTVVATVPEEDSAVLDVPVEAKAEALPQAGPTQDSGMVAIAMAQPEAKPIETLAAAPSAPENTKVIAITPYTNFVRRRDAIEKHFEADPTRLQKSGELQRLYGEYLAVEFELNKKWAKETAKRPERAKLHTRLREAELFGKADKTIDSLAMKLDLR